MENLLWTKLCRAYGCEEEFYVRRRRNIIFQIVQNMKLSLQRFPCIYIDSGSRAEGLSLPGSDMDHMFVETDIYVLPLSDPYCQQADLIMETEHLKPGFAFLRVTKNSRCLLADRYGHRFDLVLSGSSYYLSSLLYRDRNLRNAQSINPNCVQHGPCITDISISEVERDIAYCFSCKIWPDKASEWILRQRPNNWPPGELIQDIVSDGCLIVPIGNPFSENEILEWRISFSLAEKNLVHSMNHTQLVCYGVLKAFLKHGIESDRNLKGTLCSYFLKTCLFYSIEEDSVIWNKSNIKKCLLSCFRRLRYCVMQNCCPNYFIKDNNMLEGKLNEQKQVKLLEYLIFLCQHGINIYISRLWSLSLNNSCNERNSRVGILMELEFLTDTTICGVIKVSSFGFLQFRTFLCIINLLENSISTLPLDKFVINVYRYYYQLLLSQCLYHHFLKRVASNKQNYKLFKLISNILHDCGGYDICSGLLNYATLCYNTGQFNIVLCILNNVLSQFKKYTLYYGNETLKDDKSAYMSEICGLGLTYKEKVTKATSRVYQVLTHSRLYPSDIEREVNLHSSQGWTFIPPVVYANVLLFLSYKELGYTDLQGQTLNDLYAAAYSDRFVTDKDRPLALTLLYKCLQLHNE